MIETIFLAFLIGKIKGYKIKPIFKTWQIYPPIFLEIICFILQINIFRGNYHTIIYFKNIKTIYLMSYIFLILKYKEYVQAIIGSVFIFIGSFLNKIAILKNNGKMPVFPTLSYKTGYATKEAFNIVKDIHILGDENSSVIFLTDIFDLGYSVLSIGDILIRAYVFIIIYTSIKLESKKQEQDENSSLKVI
ncbi:DUF5317 family protein [Clostridium sp. CTA-19]